MTPRVVFDCMVFLQGAARPTGPAGACLRLVDDDRVILCLSDAILDEVRDVLSRPKLQQKFSALTADWVAAFVSNLTLKGVRLASVPIVESLPRDPKDEPYLNLAVGAQAAFLVSRDLDLLDLMKDAAFRQRHPDLTILDPPAFLAEMARQQPP